LPFYFFTVTDAYHKRIAARQRAGARIGALFDLAAPC